MPQALSSIQTIPASGDQQHGLSMQANRPYLYDTTQMPQNTLTAPVTNKDLPVPAQFQNTADNLYGFNRPGSQLSSYNQHGANQGGTKFSSYNLRNDNP